MGYLVFGGGGRCLRMVQREKLRVAAVRTRFRGEVLTGVGWRLFVARTRALEARPLYKALGPQEPGFLAVDRAYSTASTYLDALAGLCDGSSCAAIRIEDKRDRRITLYRDPVGQRARMHGDWNTASRCSRFFRLGLSTFSLGDERVDDQVLAVSSRSSTVRSAIFSASLSGISPSRHACSDLGIDQRFGKKNCI